MVGNNLKLMNRVYHCLYEENGDKLPQPVGVLAGLHLTPERLSFVMEFMEFMLRSSILNQAAHIYVRSPYESMKATFLCTTEITLHLPTS